MPLNKMRSIHDNNIYRISIGCENKRIILHTEYSAIDPPEYTDVVFNNVICHHFEHIWEGNILLDIEDVDTNAFYTDYESWLKSEEKYGFPVSVSSIDKFESEISSKGLKIYIINPSYGMWGWVICSNVEYQAKDKKLSLA